MAWVWTQDKTEMVDVVSIQLSVPTMHRGEGRDQDYGLIGICLNKQLHNLGLFSTRERAHREMGKFALWLQTDLGLGAYQVTEEKEIDHGK